MTKKCKLYSNVIINSVCKNFCKLCNIITKKTISILGDPSSESIKDENVLREAEKIIFFNGLCHLIGNASMKLENISTQT